MLPISFLPTVEPGTFLNSLEAGYPTVSAGDSTDPLDSAFARILGSSSAALLPDALPVGETLPAGGNPSPLSSSDGSPAAVGPEEIAASLEEQIARLMPSNGPPAESGIASGPTADEAVSDNETVAQYVEAEAGAYLDHTVPVSPELRADRPAAQKALPAIETVPAQSPGELETAIPATMSASAVMEPTRVAGLKDPPQVPASTASRLAADSQAAELKQPSAALDEPMPPGTDRRVVENLIADSRTTGESKATGVTPNPTLSVTPHSDQAGAESIASTRFALNDSNLTPLTRSVPSTAPGLAPPAVPVQHPAWGEAVSERVVMMAANKLQAAEIRLTPAELGPLRIQVEMQDGSAQVSFVAQHAVTRDALEQALPRLRDMFADAGIQLGDARVDVDTADARERQAEQEFARDPGLQEAGDTDVDLDETARGPVREQRGLVDTFV